VDQKLVRELALGRYIAQAENVRAAETEGQLAERLAFHCKPKLVIVNELGHLPFEKRSAHLFFQRRRVSLREGLDLDHDAPGRHAVGSRVWYEVLAAGV
jgi:hypothetical protein